MKYDINKNGYIYKFNEKYYVIIFGYWFIYKIINRNEIFVYG